MERSGVHDGEGRCRGRFRTAEKGMTIVYGQMFARRSSPGRYAAQKVRAQGRGLPDLCYLTSAG
jgi:hypothetical protein